MTKGSAASARHRVLAAAGAALLAVQWAGLPVAFWRKASLLAFAVAGLAARAGPSPTGFFVGGSGYEVTLWCTPWPLWAAALGLIALRRPRRAALAGGAAAVLAPLALAANLLLSVWLRGVGWSWPWAHRPGLAAAYGFVLIAVGLAGGRSTASGATARSASARGARAA